MTDNLDKEEIIFQSRFSKEEVREFFEKDTKFYHTMNINGIKTENTKTSSEYQKWISQVIPNDLTGKKILDVGCADGFYSFLCEKRNANRILAIDQEGFDKHKTIAESGTKVNMNYFELFKKLLDSKVEYRKLDVYDIDLLKETSDFILFFGVYYHIENLISVLRKISSVVNDSVFLSGHILESENPIMYYYDQSDSTKHGSAGEFAPIVASPQCLINIAKSICGFRNAELVDTISMPYERTYPHFFSDSNVGKIGLFKFSK